MEPKIRKTQSRNFASFRAVIFLSAFNFITRMARPDFPVGAYSVLMICRRRSNKFTFGNDHGLAADRDMDVRAVLFGLQEKQGWPADLVALLTANVNAVLAEIAMLYQIAGQAAVAAAGGRVFGNAETIDEYPHADVVLRFVRLRAKDQYTLWPTSPLCCEIFVMIDLGGFQGGKGLQRYDEKRQSRGNFLDRESDRRYPHTGKPSMEAIASTGCCLPNSGSICFIQV